MPLAGQLDMELVDEHAEAEQQPQRQLESRGLRLVEPRGVRLGLS
jgi:hypothetical protein